MLSILRSRVARSRFVLGLLPVLTIGLAAVPSQVCGALTEDVAVIVHPSVPASNLSLGDLRRIALGDRQFWSPGLRVTLLIRAPGSHERAVILKRVYEMSEAGYRQYWIAKVFRAEAISGPKVVNSDATAAEVVANVPGAIAFVDAGQVPRGVKTLKIDGHLPGEAGYPLH